MLVLSALLLTSDARDVAAFFPLVPGTKWVYEDRVGKNDVQYFEDRIETPVKIGELEATPMTTYLGGRKLDSSFYRYQGDDVMLVANEPDKPFAKPYSVFRFTSNRANWDFSGETQFLGGPAGFTMKCESKAGGERTFDGKRLRTLELRVEATINGGSGTTVKTVQVATYGESVGLLEMKETGTIAGQKHNRVRKLIEFTPGRSATY